MQIEEYKDALSTINSIINNKGIAEIKIENGKKIVVVEVNRAVRASENIKERMELVDDFNKANLTALAAIRCLDEGINIPSIKSALVLSSNDDYREFVQRRGRILRLYKNKKTATIYDIVVLPSHETQKWAEIELRRFYEYGHLATNWEDLKTKYYPGFFLDMVRGIRYDSTDILD